MAQIEEKDINTTDLVKELALVKKNIKSAVDYFKDNNETYKKFKRFINKSNLTQNEVLLTQQLNKPPVQFNVCSAYKDRLCGEFSKIDPAFFVRSVDSALVSEEQVAFVEGHMKADFLGSRHDLLSVKLYGDALDGGFTVASICPEYRDNMSFDYQININIEDPTLCFFDPLAKESHKGDGSFCGQFYPKTKEECIEIYGEKAFKNAKFTIGTTDNFAWYYRSGNQDIVVLCDYFFKRKKRTKILKLSDGRVVTRAQYKKMMKIWEDFPSLTEQAPQVFNERMSTIETIERYRLCGDQVLEHDVTDFSYFPLVFIEGKSEMISDSEKEPTKQFTIPFVFHAYDAQRMKNYAGQTLVAEIENMIMHKWMACIEGIPDKEDYLQAYINNQEASILLYKAYMENNPDKPLPPPREIARVPLTPEVMQAFQVADSLIQMILGSYDAIPAINNKDISGVAIQQGALQTNAAAMPYMTGFINGWNRLGQIYVDLLPKYYLTPRKVPILTKDGKEIFVDINKPGFPNFQYDANLLRVEVRAGVNFEVQKQIALRTIENLMRVSEQFNQFMNQKGLPILLDNIDIRGIEILKSQSEEWIKQQEQIQQQMAQRQAQLPTPEEMAMLQLQLENKKIDIEAQITMAKVGQQAKEVDTKAQVELIKTSADDAVKNKQADIDLLEVMAKIEGADADLAIEQEKVDAENTRSAVEMAISASAHHNQLNKSMEQQ